MCTTGTAKEGTAKDLPVLRGMMAGINPVRPNQIKIGVVGTMRKVFDTDKGVHNFQALLADLAKDPRVQIVSLDQIGIPDGIIWAGQRQSTKQTINFLRGEAIDGLLIMACNYGDENSASQIAAEVHRSLRIPVYTYMCPDDDIRKDGTRVLDCECGPFPMRQQMRRMMGKNPGYFPFCGINDNDFADAYDRFIRVCAAVHTMRNVICLQVGGNQPTFPAIEAEIHELRQRWGFEIEMAETLSLYIAVTKWLAGDKPVWFDGLRDELLSILDFSATQESQPDLPDKLTLTLGWIIEKMKETECNCVTIRCWAELTELLGMQVCALNGLLYHVGILAPCETDKPGMMASALLHGLCLGDEKEAHFFADLTRWNNGQVLWWHCGPFDPFHLRECDSCKAKIGCGWVFKDLVHGGYVDGRWGQIGDPVTFAQIRANTDGELQLVAFDGDICDGPETRGTHFYTEFSDPERAFAFVQENPVDHHHSGVIGDMLPIIKEAAPWLGLDTEPAFYEE